MSDLVENARKNKIWYLLSSSTGYSRSYCKMVLKGDRNPDTKGGKKIIEKYNELKKLLSHD
ncbi:MAG TPA: hypothetical protein VF677_12675 [Flavobacterium sp.]|jgi:hypothetical protein